MPFRRLLAQSALTYARATSVHRGKDWLLRHLSQLLGPTVQRSADGPLLEVFLDSSMDQWLLKESLIRQDHAMLTSLLRLEPGDVFIDVGANIGFYSILASKRVGVQGRVLAFEPSYREYCRLLHNVRLNQSNNVVCYNLGLGDHSGQFSFLEAEGHTGLGHFASDEPTQLGRTRILPVLPLSMLHDHIPKSGRIGIKIDVEGAELNVLRGMPTLLTEDRVSFVVAEITPTFLRRFGDTKEALYKLMTCHGFRSLHDSEEWQYDDVFVRV
jgi:FkbM family methyltransferase